MRWIDRGAVIVLAIFGALHGVAGTLLEYPFLSEFTVWSFSGAIAIWAIALLNWLRIGRPGDRTIALWSLVFSLSWVGIMFWITRSDPKWIADPRPYMFMAVCAVLAFFSARALGNRAA